MITEGSYDFEIRRGDNVYRVHVDGRKVDVRSSRGLQYDAKICGDRLDCVTIDDGGPDDENDIPPDVEEEIECMVCEQ